jgi:LmbE family N-acetylglucosaminyl deacetylase
MWLNMKFHKANADILVPDGSDLKLALERTTHMGVGAHQDDLETMAIHGILECFGRKDKWFAGVTCTDGAGSARSGVYADYTDEDMKKVRLEEQRTAACIGRYSAMIQLGYNSKEAKTPTDKRLEDDLVKCFKVARPQVVYTHNPADKHPTHVGVCMAVVGALRRLPLAQRPKKVYGVESWRSLDWLRDDRKVLLDISGKENLINALIGVFDSQIAEGKRYDLAAAGRYRANATFLDAHAVDTFQAVAFALDLTPAVRDADIDIVNYVVSLTDELKGAVQQQLRAATGRDL